MCEEAIQKRLVHPVIPGSLQEYIKKQNKQTIKQLDKK